MAENKKQSSRRKFLQSMSGSALLLAASGFSSLANEPIQEKILPFNRPFSPNDTVRIGVIGMGIMGFRNLASALKVPGVELVAVCDLYTGRLARAKELYGDKLIVSSDYREIISRKDIDAVIVATSDNWHARITTDALKAGKAVYCEKPMVHRISEGLPMIAAQKASGKVLQIGSQGVSSIVAAKAAELYKAGAIGKLNMVEATYDRQSALGAWQYTMPDDASPETVSWDKYIAGTKKIPYDAKKFFWWRNYRDYGTGVAGDLYVHLLSKLHVITGSLGPEKIFSSGQLSHWKDGRDVPDVMAAIMDYPKSDAHDPFQMSLRVNFISGSGDTGSVKMIGEEGAMEIRGNSLIIRHSLMPKAPGIGGWDALETYPKAMQERLRQAYNNRYSAEDQKTPTKPDIEYKAPPGYNEHVEHFTNFFDAVRTGKTVVEDGVFGFRAAAPCLACNDSYFEQKIIHWDPVNMKIKNPSQKK